MASLRNICIVAHVDHGKTTLIDHILRQSQSVGESISERVMDNNDLEKEKGITISAKNASFRIGDTKINIIDTPGHADFGGEVERALTCAEGAVLLVDALEGPLPQTRFVLEKALALGLKFIVCINKVDRKEIQGDLSQLDSVVNTVFDLFIELGATEEQCAFPVVYACAKDGWCTQEAAEIPGIIAGDTTGSLKPLYDLIMSEMPEPKKPDTDVARSLVFNLSWSDYVGTLAISKILSGRLQVGGQAYRFGDDGHVEKFTVRKLLCFDGLGQTEVDSVEYGDVCLIAGSDHVTIGDTIADQPDIQPLPRIHVEAPTLKAAFTINSSPNSGQDGTAIQSRKLLERLQKETRTNVALKLADETGTDESHIFGRGELQFAILIETMRREGLEFMVGKPIVLEKTGEDGQTLEPIEEAIAIVPEDHSGAVTELFQNRKGILALYENMANSRVKLTFDIPSRSLLGIRSRFLTLTKGEGLLSSKLKEYQPKKGDFRHRVNGSLISDRSGKATDYSLANLEDRGVLFIKPGTEVYEGMVIGEHNRVNDLNVNAVRGKKLTNVRSVNSDGLIILSGIRDLSLEEMLEWIDDDEWIEVTPKHLRIRKKVLACNERSIIRGPKKK